MSLSEICWSSGVPIEGEGSTILEPVVDRIPWSAKLFGAAVGKGKEVRGWRRKAKCQMPKFKCQKGKSKSQMMGSEPRARTSRTRTRNLERRDNGVRLSTVKSGFYRDVIVSEQFVLPERAAGLDFPGIHVLLSSTIWITSHPSLSRLAPIHLL